MCPLVSFPVELIILVYILLPDFYKLVFLSVTSPCLPPAHKQGKGGGQGMKPKGDLATLGAPPGCLPSPPPIYMWEGAPHITTTIS